MAIVNPFLINETRFVRTGNRGFSRAPTADTFPTANGQITIGAVQENQVRRLFSVLGRADLANDPRFSDRDARMAHEQELQAELKAELKTRSAAEWGPILAEAGVPAGEVLNFQEPFSRGWMDDRQLTLTIPYGEATGKILNAGFCFDDGGPGLSEPAPKLGEHTGTI